MCLFGIFVEDTAANVVPVCSLWSKVGRSVLQSYQKVNQLNLEQTLYEIFQSAQRMKNMSKWRRFTNQKEYTDYMRVGIKLCDICQRHGRHVLIRNVYVGHALLEMVRIHQDKSAGALSSQSCSPTAYTGTQLQLLKAGFLQLSKLDLERHSSHIRQIGRGLRNCPAQFFDTNWIVDDWTRPLRNENLFCPTLQDAIENLYGVDWCWERLPHEIGRGPIVGDDGSRHFDLSARCPEITSPDPLFHHPRKTFLDNLMAKYDLVFEVVS